MSPLWWQRLRRLSQILFLLLFLLLLLKNGLGLAGGGFDSSANLFFKIDPLAALANALASRSLYQGLLWSLLILVPVLFLGRFFCGWICPMGTLNHFFGWLKSDAKRGKKRLESNRYKGWQRTKYYLLFGGLTAAAFGSGVIGWLDPFSLLTRSLGLSILPSLNYAIEALLRPLEQSNWHGLSLLGGILHWLAGAALTSSTQQHFRQGFVLGVIFLLLMAANLKITRFWCRAICPLGALLGLCSRWSLLRLHKDEAACTKCQRCLLDCQGGDDPVPGAKWHAEECHLCLNCMAACPEKSLQFKLLTIEPAAEVAPDLGRRKAIAAVALGAAALPMMRASSAHAADFSEKRIRPAGSLDEDEFLSRCIRCGECMKACPNNALHPSLTEAGFEGLWTPVLVPRIGHCSPSCTRCSQICPTGAIWHLTEKEKGWSGGVTEGNHPVKLGTAFYDKGRCLPWAEATECAVCEEWCPTSPKAIYLVDTEVATPDGGTKTVKQPRVDPSRCVGCGSCEFCCPLKDKPGVAVSSIGESRSKSNQILLEHKS